MGAGAGRGLVWTGRSFREAAVEAHPAGVVSCASFTRLFTDAYAPMASCTPTRYSLLTGEEANPADMEQKTNPHSLRSAPVEKKFLSADDFTRTIAVHLEPPPARPGVRGLRGTWVSGMHTSIVHQLKQRLIGPSAALARVHEPPTSF